MIGAEQGVEVALIGMIGAVLVALIGVGSRLHSKLAKVEHGINHVDEEPAAAGGPTTLGQLVKQIDSKVDLSAKANDFAHHGFDRLLAAQGEAIHAVSRHVDSVDGQLVDHLEQEQRLERKVDAVLGEVETGNTNKLGALAEAAEGRRIETDIPKDDRTTHEQEGVDRLHNQHGT